jgi:hypothetical protein
VHQKNSTHQNSISRCKTKLHQKILKMIFEIKSEKVRGKIWSIFSLGSHIGKILSVKYLYSPSNFAEPPTIDQYVQNLSHIFKSLSGIP